MADDKNIGRLIQGRYRLDALLGRGGFGSVYRGWDSQIGRDVAVKLLDVTNRARSAQQTAELRERFRREAMAAGRITHHGVVTIYDFGIPEDGGEAYLVMELLEGHDLSSELKVNGPMSPDRVQRLFIPMLEALGRGHDLGIVHKDIKPQNIFFCHPGTNSEAFCLVDFGVARVVHEDKLTMTGLIVGTPQYMAPEYITDTLVTPALDVYQMALILVELITGAPAVPAGESFVKSCNRHFTGDLAVPPELLEGEFGRMLQMALRPIPKERLQDATKFAEMFAEIDPSTIVIDSSSTMVFMRDDKPEKVDTIAEPPMFRPMKPDQVSAELERLEKGSDGYLQPKNTPVATLEPVETPVKVAVGAGGSEAAVALAEDDGTLPPDAPTTPPGSDPAAPLARPEPPETAPQTAPTPGQSGRWLGAAAIVGLLVGGVAIAMALASGPDEPAEPPIVAEPIPSATEPAVEPPTEVVAPTMTTIRSEPSGARIIVDGREVGTTPGEVAIDSSDAAELHLQGYEVALVKLEADLETIELTRAPEPSAPTAKHPTRKPKAGKTFVPPEPKPEVDEKKPIEIADDGPVKPAKFKAATNNKPSKAAKVHIAP